MVSMALRTSAHNILKRQRSFGNMGGASAWPGTCLWKCLAKHLITGGYLKLLTSYCKTRHNFLPYEITPILSESLDRRQQFSGFATFALGQPQASKTHGDAQLPGFRLLFASDVEGVVKTCLCLRGIRRSLLQENLTV